MAYVSCRYGPPPELEIDVQQIICTDEAGMDWSLPPDCQVGDWLRFVAAGGIVDPYEPPPDPEVEHT